MQLKDLSRIGPKTLECLNALGIYTPEELLLSFPQKYLIYELEKENLYDGRYVCFAAKICSRPFFIKYRRNVNAIVFYSLIGNERIKCIMFSGDYLRYKLNNGLDIIAYGRYKVENKEFVLHNIFFEQFFCRIDVDYNIKNIQNKTLQTAIKSALQLSVMHQETLPVHLLEKYHLLPMDQLIKKAHFPENRQDCIQVRRRRRYEDFFWYACSLESLKQLRSKEQKVPKTFNNRKINQFIERLPYQLTVDQGKAIEHILHDLISTFVMNRLIQGDVGCGKSIVAVISALATLDAGYQVALMAPTEILAKQHYESFVKLFQGLGYQVVLLTSNTKKKDKEEIYYKLLHQRIHLVIGTHALLQENVVFSKLGLAIIDEQHRFGVNQRKTLLEKYKGVDALYLTATPIPRTLGLTTFGDLDLTSIKTMPLNRKPVVTKLILQENILVLEEILKRHIQNKEQIYVVVPLVNESSALDYIDINSAFDIISKMLPSVSIGMIHGKLKANEKSQIMQDFKACKIDILIATTVIEVGVDVANATVMVILDAERYGLSQIHQLRGRVGRGSAQSYCYLVSKQCRVQRLDILEKTSDGFILAEEDFKLRGPGDYLGEEQSGFLAFDFEEDSKDAVIWKYALEDSKKYVASYFQQNIINDKMEKIIQKNLNKKTKIN